jgi:hypothetical protein
MANRVYGTERLCWGWMIRVLRWGGKGKSRAEQIQGCQVPASRERRPGHLAPYPLAEEIPDRAESPTPPLAPQTSAFPPAPVSSGILPGRKLSFRSGLAIFGR